MESLVHPPARDELMAALATALGRSHDEILLGQCSEETAVTSRPTEGAIAIVFFEPRGCLP